VNDPVLSVVIPSYNGLGLLKTCLAGIDRHRPMGVPTEVIVADDASTDGSASWLGREYPEVRVVRLSTNGGFVAAANAGIAAARGEFIQLLNNDTTVLPGWVEAGLLPFADATVGSVAPLVLFRSDPTRVDSAGDRYALIGWPSKRGHGQSAAVWSARHADRVFGASGSSAFYRAEALRRVGGYDTQYGSYYEDVDLAFRLRWAGYHCVFAPRCRILHDVSASYDHGRPELQRRMSRNAELLFWSNLPAPWLAAAVGPHAGFLVAQAAVRLARGRLGPFLAGKLDAIRLVSAILQRRGERARLASQAIARPRFPMGLIPLVAAWDHVRRPRTRTGFPLSGPHRTATTKTRGVPWTR
jgi:GT2 family glycosyltransferase